MAERDYRIDFFQLSTNPTGEVRDTTAGFLALRDEAVVTSAEIAQYTREVWRLQRRQRPASYAGQFRKFRMDDLPEIGEVGRPGRQLEIAEDAGLIEKNFFIFYEEMSLLAWHGNRHANGVGQFARFLSNSWGTRVDASPVLQPDAARRLLRRGIELKRMEVTIARPRAPDMYPNDDFGHATLDLLAGAGADTLHLSMSIDGRRNDASPHLANRMKRSLVEFANFGATTAKAIVYEDGFEHPIDLLADRISSIQTIEHDGRYAGEVSMFQAIDDARNECEDALREYFGAIQDGVL